MTDRDLLAIACEQFLGKSVMEIKAVVLQTLEGHLRSILGETFTTNVLFCFISGITNNLFAACNHFQVL